MAGKTTYFMLVMAFLALTQAIPVLEYTSDSSEDDDIHTIHSPQEEIVLYRPRRSLQPGAPNFPGQNKQNGGWSFNPNVAGDGKDTKTSVNVGHSGPNHEVNAGWEKVVRGPNKAKPSWHVGGTFKW